MQAEMKIWFVENDKKIFGEGPYRLLKYVEEDGSLRKAAGRMEMSYSKAWSLIKLIEKELDIQLLNKSIGGQEGGGSKITEDALALMKKYEHVSKKMRKELEYFNRSMGQ
ncbi:winged helix-turn-helix domain-containing protein [Isachenkonia alkalipeptolytica]|uniref:LysR family transcriptional regulator n=1 Tax=Isachenkonia alkalipeptolytica TaxID=2565777 RepID=A0AA43XM86_9CLOT|nr:LysR family transcriptional regulator [Isachenkonia alkalipeptolytica]NBG89267.1 LysR family transcriptional regulator [Isachenkonia alkalipeptolytica]